MDGRTPKSVFTRRVLKILHEYAPQESQKTGTCQLCVEHILLAMLRSENFQFLRELVVGQIFGRLHVNVENLVIRIEKALQTNSPQQPDTRDHGRIVEAVTKGSQEEAERLNHLCVGSEHILLALLHDGNHGVESVLADFGVTYQRVRAELMAMRA
ncbi:MAG: hypothetical protein KF713_13355 [Turneriella sp.]|nr:hypothetical protein [Turneriella sp.]